MIGIKNVTSGVLLLFFSKTLVEWSQSQNEAAIWLLAQAPAISSQIHGSLYFGPLCF